jgi:hypothetical protein
VTSQGTERDQLAWSTHVLESAEVRLSESTEIKRASLEYSRPGEYRWRHVKTAQEYERARDPHCLESIE